MPRARRSDKFSRQREAILDRDRERRSDVRCKVCGDVIPSCSSPLRLDLKVEILRDGEKIGQASRTDTLAYPASGRCIHQEMELCVRHIEGGSDA